jgi:hypothetical protein
MQIQYGKRRDFWGYLSSLRYLEQAFRAVGIKVDIELSIFSKTGEKWLQIETGTNSTIITIDGLTPEQAVKSAACFLAKDSYGHFCSHTPIQLKKEKKNG